MSGGAWREGVREGGGEGRGEGWGGGKVRDGGRGGGVIDREVSGLSVSGMRDVIRAAGEGTIDTS